MTQPFFDNWQSLEIQPATRCNVSCGKNAELQTQSDPNVKTIWDIFLRGVHLSKERPCFGWRNGDKYDFISFQEAHDRVLTLAKALRQKLGLARGQFVGLYSANSPQWMISAMACASSSLVLVPLYDTLGADSCSFIMNEVNMSILLVDTIAAGRRIFESLKRVQQPSDIGLKTLVLIGEIGKFELDPPPADFLDEATKQFGLNVLSINDLIKDVAVQHQDGDDATAYLPSPDDLYMVQYTSGTTGNPKGVMITHGNFVANEASIQTLYKQAAPDSPQQEMCLHYLPLAHAYGQLLVLCLIYYGASCSFFSGNVQKLAEDAAIVKPTYMPLVPRLMNKVYSKVVAEVKSKGLIANKLFWFAYARKREMLRRGVITTSSIWDKIVFRKLQAKLGGRIKYMLTASAPVSPEVLEFWRVVFGAHIFEAYGQTECTALVTAAVDPNGGNIGHPVSCNMVKLVDVAELGYFAKDHKGEVCVKGPNVTKGYFKRPDLTAEAIDADGWVHTGDIGEFLPDGALRLIDRKKHIFKLAQGEYIAPEKIESVYASSPLVAQVYVDGNGLQWFTVAIVVPDPVEAQNWAQKKGIKADMAELCKNDDFIQEVLGSLLAYGRAKGLNRLEQIRSIYLHPEMFTIADGLLTPSMKNRRPQLRAKFTVQLDEMYKNGPLAVAQTQSISADPNNVAAKNNNNKDNEK